MTSFPLMSSKFADYLIINFVVVKNLICIMSFRTLIDILNQSCLQSNSLWQVNSCINSSTLSEWFFCIRIINIDSIYEIHFLSLKCSVFLKRYLEPGNWFSKQGTESRTKMVCFAGIVLQEVRMSPQNPPCITKPLAVPC